MNNIKNFESIDSIDFSDEDVAYIFLLCGGGDTFNAILWLSYKRPTVNWKIITWKRQKEIVDIFIKLSSPSIFQGQSSISEILYVEDFMCELDVYKYLDSKYPFIAKYRGLQAYISRPGLYWGWHIPSAYPYVFRDLNNDLALRHLAHSCLLEATNSDSSRPSRVLIAIYPESNHHPENICNVFDFWDPIIKSILKFRKGCLPDSSNIIVRINSNINSYGFPGGGTHLNRLHNKWSALTSDLNPSVLYSFSQMNHKIITLGFRSGLHDWARVLPQAYHLIMRHYSMDPSIDMYTADFGLNSIGCNGLFDTLFMKDSEILEICTYPKLVISLICSAIDRPSYFRSCDTANPIHYGQV